MLADTVLELRQRFLAQWPVDAPVAVLDNETNLSTDNSTPWVRFSVVPGVQRRDSFGESETIHTQLGRVYLSVYVPKRTGSLPAFQHAGTFADIFRNWTNADRSLRCSTPQTDTDDSDEDWFRVQVSVPWEKVERL